MEEEEEKKFMVEKIQKLRKKKMKEEEDEEEDEDEGVTRFGNTHQPGTEIEDEDSNIEHMTHNTNNTLQEDAAISYKDVDLIGEYETIFRRIPLREMSVIEEEDGEDGTEDTLSNGVDEFADEVAAWVLGEACLEVGRAWEKVTAAWEEMTFSDLVQRRKGKHHRQLYKTISMVGPEARREHSFWV